MNRGRESAVLEVKDLTVRFKGRYHILKGRSGSVAALKSVSCSLERGAALAVIGESGSGKTTLLRAILGLAAPESGSVELWGRQISSITAGERVDIRRRCGYILQDPYSSLPPTMTVMGAVMEPWNIVRPGEHADGERRARELLAELRLPEELWRDCHPLTLTAGKGITHPFAP
jgi:ABC-type glutathione transport system ATPase component